MENKITKCDNCNRNTDRNYSVDGDVLCFNCYVSRCLDEAFEEERWINNE